MRVLTPKTEDKKRRYTLTLFFVFSLLYRFLLDFNYIRVISPINSYDHFLLNKSGGMVSWILLIIFISLSIQYVKTSRCFISMLVLFILYFKIIPFTSYIYCAPVQSELILYESIYFIMILICFRYIPGIKIRPPAYSPFIVDIIAIVFIAVILLISGAYAKFRFHFNLMDVYDLREEARGYNLPVVLQYLHNAASKILPILLIYYLEQKKRIMISMITIAILLSFGVNGLKSTFLNLFICLLLYSFRNTPVLKKIPVLFLMIVVLGTVEYLTVSSVWIDQLFVRRLLFMPTLLDTYYYDYIDNHSPLYFNAVVNGIDISFVIGKMWRSVSCRANNGLFSDAFGNLGVIGIFVYPIIYAVFFKSFGRIIDYKDYIIRFIAAFVIAYVMLSSFFTVTLFTHGILLMCIAIIYMPNIKKSHEL